MTNKIIVTQERQNMVEDFLLCLICEFLVLAIRFSTPFYQRSKKKFNSTYFYKQRKSKELRVEIVIRPCAVRFVTTLGNTHPHSDRRTTSSTARSKTLPVSIHPRSLHTSASFYRGGAGVRFCSSGRRPRRAPTDWRSKPTALSFHTDGTNSQSSS